MSEGPGHEPGAGGVMMRRFVIFGAGAIGGLLAARLHLSGQPVTAIARGRQLAALQGDGLRLDSPEGTAQISFPTVDSPAAVSWTGDTCVILAMKSQDTVAALEALEACAPPSITVVCAQNGVENERSALRRFPRTVGMCVNCPVTFLEPGVITARAARPAGVFELGRYPAQGDGEDSEGLADSVAAALRAAEFDAVVRADVMRWKYAKLLMNLGNAVEALCGPQARGGEFDRLLQVEGRRCLAAAGIGYVAAAEFNDRMGVLGPPAAVVPSGRRGGSSWQSLARRTGRLETDYLNGEIMLLSRWYGVPAPANALVQRWAARAAQNRSAPGSLNENDLLDALARVPQG
jgi:2-dehydropantoate 2-reductase